MSDGKPAEWQDLRWQLLRLLSDNGERFDPRKWEFVFETDEGQSRVSGLADAVRYATASEGERAQLDTFGPRVYTRVSLRVRW